MTRSPHVPLWAVALVSLLTLLLIGLFSTQRADTVNDSLPAARATVSAPAPATSAAPKAAATPKPVPSRAPKSKAPKSKAPKSKAPKSKSPASNGAKTKGLGADDKWEMVPLPVLPPYNDAILKNSAQSTRNIKVCRDWMGTSCSPASPTRSLKPGQDSKTLYGWRDTDGYDIGSGWTKQHGCFQCVITVTAH